MPENKRYLTLAIPGARPRYAERDGRLYLSLPADPDQACAALGIYVEIAAPHAARRRPVISATMRPRLEA